MENGKRFALRFLGGTCGLLCESCGRPELPRRDADEPLEVMGELALVREAGAGGDLRQGEVVAALHEPNFRHQAAPLGLARPPNGPPPCDGPIPTRIRKRTAD